jgi:hypothetical protein
VFRNVTVAGTAWGDGVVGSQVPVKRPPPWWVRVTTSSPTRASTAKPSPSKNAASSKVAPRNNRRASTVDASPARTVGSIASAARRS